MNNHKYRGTMCILLTIILLISTGCQSGQTSKNCYLCGKAINGKAYQSDAYGDAVFLCESCYNDINDISTALKKETKQSSSNVNDSLNAKESEFAIEDSEMSDLYVGPVGAGGSDKYGYGIYPVVDGCAVINIAGGESKGVSYVDKTGAIIHYTSCDNIGFVGDMVLSPNKNLFCSYSSDKYRIEDANGNLIMELSKDNSLGFSAVSEDLFFVQEISKTIYGNETRLVYYDEYGNNVLSFEGMYSYGESSLFSNGMAFVYEKQESGQEESNHKDWYMINKSGGLTPVVISNPSFLSPSSLINIDEFKAGYKEIHEDEVLITDYYIDGIHSFYDGEAYSSAKITVEYDVGSHRNIVISFLGYVTKSGDVFVTPKVIETTRFSYDYSDYYGGCVVLDDGNYVYNIDTNTTITLESLDLDIDTVSVVHKKFWLLDTGNLFLTLLVPQNGVYGLLVSSNGAILSEPEYIENNSRYTYNGCTLTGSETPCNDINLSYENAIYYSKSDYGYEGKCKAILNENGLFPCRSSDNDSFNLFCDEYRYGYVNIWGEFIIEPRFTSASVFSNGYAIVATDIVTVDHSPYATGLCFINEAGELLQSISAN